MGTRRSRHNKGRKPLYKEHRFDLVDPAVIEAKRAAVAVKRRLDQGAAAAKAASEVPRYNAPWEERQGGWAAYKKRKTSNMMKPGLNALTHLIVRPGIEKKFWHAAGGQ